MNLKKYFDYTPEIDLNAAHIGISKWDWFSIDSHDQDRAKQDMQEKRFDVLPISDESGFIESYFKTNTSNDFSKIEYADITDTDVIYYRMSFEDLIRKFDQEDRFFYFLTNHKEIFGLVSLVNLNSQPVYSYLFQIVASLEKNISEKLEHQIDQKDVINTFKSSTDKLNRDIIKNFEKAVDQGRDNTVFQHMYLQNIGYVLKKFSGQLSPGLNRLEPYKSNFLHDGLYNRIRNNVMHPVRPIYNGKTSISEINQFLTDYNQIMDIVSEE